MLRNVSSLVVFILTLACFELALADCTQVVLITGAFRGLGSRISERLLNAGYCVALTGRNATERAHGLITSDRALAVNMDMSDIEQIKAGYDQVKNHFGRVDVVIHNAAHMPLMPPEALTENDLSKASQVNFIGPAYLSKLAMANFNALRPGRIIYLSSAASILREPRFAAYSSTKLAAENYFESLGNSLPIDQNIGVSILRIAFINSDYEVAAERSQNDHSLIGFMRFLRRNSTTSEETVFAKIEEEIKYVRGPIIENIGLDGKVMSVFAKLPTKIQNGCASILESSLHFVNRK